MGLSNKLGVFFVGVSLFLPNLAQALIIEPIKIDSSQGEPLYAEIPFHNASTASPVQVSVAQPFELGIPEANSSEAYSHFNFYVRQNQQGNGVIVITSTRPIHSNNLSIVLKINDSGQVHIKQVNNKLPSRIDRLQAVLQDVPLQPRIVVNEDDLKLNLPTSSGPDQPLIVSKALPPMMTSAPTMSATTTPTAPSKPALTSVTPQTPAKPQTSVQTDDEILANMPARERPVQVGLSSQPELIQNTVASASPVLQNTTPIAESQNQLTPPPPSTQNAWVNPSIIQSKPAQAAVVTPPPIMTSVVTKPQKAATPPPPKITSVTATPPNKNNDQHKVQPKESLWAIANQISKTQKIPIHTVMDQIYTNNKHAFINGQNNRLKQGAVLQIPTDYSNTARAEIAKKPAPVPKPEQPIQAQQPKPLPPTVAAPPKQTQAHMSIVANNDVGAIQGTTPKAGQAPSSQQNELTVQLKEQRSSTLGLQNSVRKLDQQLRAKEKRLALLNAQLAELEQQLKLRQEKQQLKDVSKTTSKSNTTFPKVNHSGEFTMVMNLNTDVKVATLSQELI